MPLSKKANRDRMRQVMRDKRLTEFRLQQLNPSPYQSKPVQPKPLEGTPWIDDIAEFVDSASEIDADIILEDA